MWNVCVAVLGSLCLFGIGVLVLCCAFAERRPPVDQVSSDRPRCLPETPFIDDKTDCAGS